MKIIEWTKLRLAARDNIVYLDDNTFTGIAYFDQNRGFTLFNFYINGKFIKHTRSSKEEIFVDPLYIRYTLFPPERGS